jgi:hypothetical protein
MNANRRGNRIGPTDDPGYARLRVASQTDCAVTLTVFTVCDGSPHMIQINAAAAQLPPKVAHCI